MGTLRYNLTNDTYSILPFPPLRVNPNATLEWNSFLAVEKSALFLLIVYVLGAVYIAILLYYMYCRRMPAVANFDVMQRCERNQ